MKFPFSSSNSFALLIGIFLIAGCSRTSNTDHANWRQLADKGEAALSAGRFIESGDYFKQALAGLEQEQPDSKERPGLLTKLAYSRAESGNITEAETIYKQALEANEKAYGPDCLQEIGTLERMRETAKKQKQMERCEQLARKVLQIEDKRLSPNDRRIEFAVANVIGLACANGVCKDETGLLDRLLEIRRRKYGPDTQNVIAARIMAAEAKGHHGQHLEAASLYKENIEAYSHSAPGMVPVAMQLYANSLNRAGKSREALSIMKASLKAQKQQDRDETEFIPAYCVLGDIESELGNRVEAERAYAQMEKIFDKAGAGRTESAADYLVRYAEFLKKIGKRDQAAKLDAKIASIYKGAS